VRVEEPKQRLLGAAPHRGPLLARLLLAVEVFEQAGEIASPLVAVLEAERGRVLQVVPHEQLRVLEHLLGRLLEALEQREQVLLDERVRDLPAPAPAVVELAEQVRLARRVRRRAQPAVPLAVVLPVILAQTALEDLGAALRPAEAVLEGLSHARAFGIGRAVLVLNSAKSAAIF
jgi:hypothetical protein